MAGLNGGRGSAEVLTFTLRADRARWASISHGLRFAERDPKGSGSLQRAMQSRGAGEQSSAARQRNRVPGERFADPGVHRHDLDAEGHRQGDELAIVGRAVTVAHQLEHETRIHLVLGASQQTLGLQLQVARRLECHRLAMYEPGQNVAKLAPPRQRRRPLGVMLEQGFRQLRVVTRQIQIRNDVGVDDDHGRPARL
jgi:hypothetical protein